MDSFPGGGAPGPGRMPPPVPRARPANDLLTSAIKGSAAGYASLGVALGSEPGSTPEGGGAEATTSGRSTDPLPWQDFFDEELSVRDESRSTTFHVYMAGPPRDGGPASSSCPVLLCLHGGGYSGLTFAPFAKRLKAAYRIVSPDQAGHGRTEGPEPPDLSIGALVEDFAALAARLLDPASDHFVGSAEQKRDGKRPAVLVLGHSLGGAVAARACAAKRIPGAEAAVVVDVVEGTALASLPYIMTVLQSRPASFPSEAAAIRWALRTRMTRCEESARVSVPGMLRPGAGGEVTWRTDLKPSEPQWEGWYRGMSEVFLSIPGYKLLMLAGTDRLDKALTVGQMQGKFQMAVFPTAGHPIQEDEPDKFAETVLTFLRRFQIGVRMPVGARPFGAPPPPTGVPAAPRPMGQP